MAITKPIIVETDVWARTADAGDITKPSQEDINSGFLFGQKPPHDGHNFYWNMMMGFIASVNQTGTVTWDSVTTYPKLALIRYGEVVWKALIENTDVEPGTDGAIWAEALADKALDSDKLDGMEPNELPISDSTQTALDLKADQTSLDAHEARTDDPHNVTPAQAGAVALAGDTMTGDLIIHASLNVSDDISTNGSLYVGSNLNGNSAISFNYPDVSNQVSMFWNNVTLQFEMDTPDGYGLVVWNAGNFNPDTHINATDNPHSVTKAQVGLGSADDTTDLNKPISTATQTALDLKADDSDFTAHTADVDNPHAVTKSQVGLGAVDNTTDLNKPVSTDTQTALDLKADQADLDTVDSAKYDKTEHIAESGGSGDAGKPVILDGEGKLSGSMLGTGLYPVGMFTPATGAEYPAIGSHSVGAYWGMEGLEAGVGYTFEGGDLAGTTLFNGDAMINGADEWGFLNLNIDPSQYYKVDGSLALIAPFAGGGQQLKNIADGVDPTDAVTIAQVEDFSTQFVSTSGDTMTGDLMISNGSNFRAFGLTRTSADGLREIVSQFATYVPDGTGAGYARIVTAIDGGATKETRFLADGNIVSSATAPGADDHLTRKDYVDSENATQDAEIALKADITYVDSENATQDTAIINAQGTADTAQASADTAQATADTANASIATHIADVANPHAVTPGQIGAPAGSWTWDGTTLAITI
jgi:hypothetical protein